MCLIAARFSVGNSISGSRNVQARYLQVYVPLVQHPQRFVAVADFFCSILMHVEMFIVDFRR